MKVELKPKYILSQDQLGYMLALAARAEHGGVASNITDPEKRSIHVADWVIKFIKEVSK